jgi:amino acid transporter
MDILEKINVLNIVRNHLKTLVNDNTKKPDLADWLTFLIIPLVLAGLLIFLQIGLSERATNIVITTLSILVGLLFNVIVILFDILKRDNTKKVKNDLLKQLLTNISYSIFISLVIIFLTVLSYFKVSYWVWICTFLVYFFLGHFALTVLMILKRIYALFLNEMTEIGNGAGPEENAGG